MGIAREGMCELERSGEELLPRAIKKEQKDGKSKQKLICVMVI